MNKVMLSIICLAYNHGRFIKQTLEGFVNQQTEYKYEVLINDDASTDGTTDIIREYEKKYPDIIKPVYQKENQYGKKNLTMSLIDIAKGEYFAFCEGDDSWTDMNKIQKQIEYMESHPECTLCIHNSKRITETGKFLSDIVVSDQDGIIPIENIIRGGGNFCATNSIMGKMEHAKNPPEFLLKCGLDYTWQIYLATCGYAYCFHDIMSVYRVAVAGSWSERMENDPVAYSKVFVRINEMLNSYNIWSKKKFDYVVQDCISENTYNIAVKSRDKNLVKDIKVKKWIKKQSLSFKAKYIFWKLLPGVYYAIRNRRLKSHYGFNNQS